MSNEITKDEAAIYDRQIRLWGQEAQLRIGKASILIAGMRALSDEICKNIALAGVASITLLDHEIVTEFDLGAQFFLTEDSVGQNKAEATAPGVRNLNPRVEVIVDKEDISQKPDEFFESFSIVCLVHSNYEIMSRIDQLRRAVKKPFYAADTFGWYGYVYCDVVEHTWMSKDAKPTTKESRADKKKITSGVVTHQSLDDSLQKNWEKERPKVLKRTSHLSFLIHVLLKFQKEHGRSPNCEDTEELIRNKSNYLAEMGISDQNILNDELIVDLINSLDTEISPIAAIVGGILGQDILRSLSANEPPINNWYYFDGLQGVGAAFAI